jgi:hypothetical protein
MLDYGTSVHHVEEPALVQAFIALATVEDPMQALSNGLPGWMKSGYTRRRYARHSGPALELRPMVDGDGLWKAAQLGPLKPRAPQPRTIPCCSTNHA